MTSFLREFLLHDGGLDLQEQACVPYQPLYIQTACFPALAMIQFGRILFVQKLCGEHFHISVQRMM